MAGTVFTSNSITADMPVNGQNQRFMFNEYHSTVKLGAFSKFVPTLSTPSNINVETRNNNFCGYRWNHLTKISDTIGTFKLQSFVEEQEPINIFGYDGTNFSIYVPIDVHNNRIQNVDTPILGTDAANKAYVDSMSGGGTIELTGDVTGSGTIGTPFSTTIASRLNQIPTPIGAVAMNSQKITGLANGTVSTDAVNLGQLNSSISAGTITLTGNVTGSGTIGTPFATTIVSTLNQIPIPTGTLNLNNQLTINSGSIGMGVSSFGTSDTQIQFSNTLTNRKICLWQNGTDTYQFYGFGIQGNTLVYMVPSGARHVFYCSTSSTAANEVGRITGMGDYITGGTLFGLRPGISVYLNNNLSSTPISNPTDFFRIVGNHSTTIGPAHFTLTTSNPARLTYSPNTSGNGNPPIKVLIQANVSFYYSVGNSLLRFRITKNGTSLPGSESQFTYGTSIYTAQAFFSTQTIMNAGDFIEFYVSGSPAPQNLSVTYGTFHITAV